MVGCSIIHTSFVSDIVSALFCVHARSSSAIDSSCFAYHSTHVRVCILNLQLDSEVQGSHCISCNRMYGCWVYIIYICLLHLKVFCKHIQNEF